ncbi:hypothetical protein SAMN05216413_1167 [Ruminococcaceae bacterium KH2T8]|nr:hypothetical protein SAMN05216413_1167 [Ruminococcaceae bacterium KH2T8]
MSIVVFLSNTNLQVAVGNATATGVKITKLFSAPLPEGAVLNGVVMDQDLVTQTVKTAWDLNKLPKSEITLIINSPQLRASRVDVPITSDKKTTEFIARETSDSDYGRFQKPVTGWYVVSKNSKAKTRHVIYETAETDFVEKYVEIFAKVGLKLKSLHNGVQLATEFFTRQVAGKNVIYMILDGNSLVTIFFAEGKYYYDSTSRVFAQPGTPEFAREIYASVSSIRQFISAQHLNITVNDVIFAGMSQTNVNALVNDILNIDSQVDISMATPPNGTSISSEQSSYPFYIYPISGIRKIDEKLPILKATKVTEKEKKAASGVGKVIIPFAVLLGIAIIVFAGLLYVKSSLEHELKKIKDYNSSSDTLEQVAEYDAMYDSMADIGTIQGGVDMLERDLDSYPIADSSINRMILTAAQRRNVTVDFQSYSARTGVFSITASSTTVDDINQFIGDLLDMDIFESVDYTGYTLDSDGENWTINVVCSLASPDAAAEDSEEEVS